MFTVENLENTEKLTVIYNPTIKRSSLLTIQITAVIYILKVYLCATLIISDSLLGDRLRLLS